MTECVNKTWANCKYGEITPAAHQMIMLGCVHPSRVACPICTNNPDCPYKEYRFKHIKPDDEKV